MKMIEFEDFAKTIEAPLEELRQENKKIFFGCLKPETIEELGPIYE